MLTRALTRRTSWIALALIWLQLLLPVLSHAWPRDAATGMEMAEFCTMPGMGTASAGVTAQSAVAVQGGESQPGAMSCAWCCGCSATAAALPTQPTAGLAPEPSAQPLALSDRPAPRPAVPLQRAAARAPPARS